MKTIFLGVRKPTLKEKQFHLCDLVFQREDSEGNEILIYVNKPAKDYGWFQWGQENNILGENLDDLENYLDI